MFLLLHVEISTGSGANFRRGREGASSFGSSLSLLTNAKIVPGSDKLGKYALQTAIILLGLKLNAAMLIQISADYSLMVTFYVLATLAVGFTIGRLLRTLISRLFGLFAFLRVLRRLFGLRLFCLVP